MKIIKKVKKKLTKTVSNALKNSKREEYVTEGFGLVKHEEMDEWIKFVDAALIGTKYSDNYYVMMGDLRSEVILENVIDGLVMLDKGYDFSDVDKTMRMYSQGEELRFIRRSLIKFSVYGMEYFNYLKGDEPVKVKVKRR